MNSNAKPESLSALLKLSAALASMTDAVFITDVEGRLVEFNEAFATIHKFKSKDECARTFLEYPELLDLFYPDGSLVPVDQWAVPRALRGETGTNVEFSLRRRDTGESWVGSYSFAPIREESGAIVGSVGIGRDITEQKRREDALRESEERFTRAFHASPAGQILTTVAEGRVVDVNDAYCEVVGRPREELIGRTAAELQIWVNMEDRDRAMEELRSTGRLRSKDVQLRSRTRGVRHVIVSGEMVEIGGIPCVIATGLDVTDRKRVEAQLLHAQKMDSIGRLAGGVAHDFNNILMVQKGYCEILRRGLREDDPLAEGVAQIEACADRAAALTRQLLAFSRKQTLQPKLFDLNTLVQNLDSMLRRVIGEDVELRTLPCQSATTVRADPGQIEQVIINLAVNARDAMPQGGKLTIEIAEATLDEAYAASHMGVTPGRYVMLAVSDTGCGMDEETQKRLFEPFFTTKREGKGTGLGLAMVHGIVHQSGGNIWLYSEPNKGTTFKVYLPRVDAEPQAVSDRQPSAPRGEGELVLLVEDEALLSRLLLRQIGSLGYKVRGAENGGAALILVEEQGLRPDLLVTDVVMPGMSGRVLVERLQKTIPDLTTIFISGYTDNAIVHHGILDAGVDFLQKPFSKADLAEKISAALRKRRARRGAGA